MPNTVKYEVRSGRLEGRDEVVFEIYKGRKFVGTLEVSPDSLVWVAGRGSQYAVDWLTFDEIMQDNVSGRHPGRRRRVGQR